MSVLNIKTNEIKMVNSDFDTIINRYNTLVSSFYQRINAIEEKTNEWSGNDAQRFIEMINKNKILYENLGKVLKSYSNCLNSIVVDIDRLVKVNKL